jgi:hypothetical protein
MLYLEEWDRTVDRQGLRVQQFVRRDTRADLDGEESSQPNQELLEINVILGGTSTRGDSGSGKKKYRK